MTLPPHVRAEVQRILDREARLALEQLNGDSAGSDRCHCFNYRWCSRWVENTVGGMT